MGLRRAEQRTTGTLTIASETRHALPFKRPVGLYACAAKGSSLPSRRIRSRDPSVCGWAGSVSDRSKPRRGQVHAHPRLTTVPHTAAQFVEGTEGLEDHRIHLEVPGRASSPARRVVSRGDGQSRVLRRFFGWPPARSRTWRRAWLRRRTGTCSGTHSLL